MPTIRTASKTRRHTRDYDQIYTDLRSARKLQQLRESVPDDEKPGMGQWHCVECAKYLESEHAYKEHKRGKKHKRMLRILREQPYTQEEADAAIGSGVMKYESKRLKAEMEELKALEVGEKPMEVDDEEPSVIQHETVTAAAAAAAAPALEDDDLALI